jgi:hypothetical protein
MVSDGIFRVEETARTMGSLIPKGTHRLKSAVATFEPQAGMGQSRRVGRFANVSIITAAAMAKVARILDMGRHRSA